jgi:hypothetical protein
LWHFVHIHVCIRYAYGMPCMHACTRVQ